VQNSKNNKIAIIGASGFLGSRLSNLLKKKDISHNKYDINSKTGCISIDVENKTSLNKLSGSDIIINLAAVHRDDIRPLSRYDDVNVQGSLNICNAAKLHGINTIIFTSSVAVYGFAPAGTNESGKPNYFNDYGRTKYLAEQVYKEWQAEDKKNRTLIIIRPTVIFGEGNRGNVYNLLNQIASGRFVMFGSGQNIKSMAYVENVAAFIEHSMSFKPGQYLYNYIDKPDYDMNRLISKVRQMIFKKDNLGIRLPAAMGIMLGYFADFIAYLTGMKLSISSIRVKKFMSTTHFESSVSKTNFVPPISLEEGLDRTIRYEFLEDNSHKQTFETE
jgi:nucleoside-diphosphate-sugar epimerase